MNDFYDIKLENLIKKMKKHSKNFILGEDFNATLDKDMDWINFDHKPVIAYIKNCTIGTIKKNMTKITFNKINTQNKGGDKQKERINKEIRDRKRKRVQE